MSVCIRDNNNNYIIRIYHSGATSGGFNRGKNIKWTFSEPEPYIIYIYRRG